MATILIVDDVEANRTLLGTVLRHHGHGVLEAPNGERALMTAKSDRPDLVVTDVLMPVMDGYEFVRQLRADPDTKGIPVVFHTAHYGEREARELALANGVAWVMTKPAPASVVVDIVARALAGELETGVAIPAARAETFDHEHMRLMTDKLSQKTGYLRTMNARLRALINIGMELASEPDTERLLESVCVAARDLFGATYVTLGMVERQMVQRVLSFGADTTGTIAHARWIQAGDVLPGIFTQVIANRQTLFGDNPARNPEALQLPADHPPVRSYLVAPVASPNQVFGWLCLVANEERYFTDDDRQLAIALGGQVGRVYEAAFRYSEGQARCRDIERELLVCRENCTRFRAERDNAEQKLAARKPF